MKKAIFSLLVLPFLFGGCSKTTPVDIREAENPNTSMREEDEAYFGTEVIDFHRERSDGTFYESPPENYHFSKEGIFNYDQAYLFIDEAANITEIYYFSDEGDIPSYQTEGQIAYRANRVGPQNYPTTPCPASGINCGRDGGGAYYLFTH